MSSQLEKGYTGFIDAISEFLNNPFRDCVSWDWRCRVLRKREERSCNYVGAVCAQGLKKNFTTSVLTGAGRGLIGGRCTEDDYENVRTNLPIPSEMFEMSTCNARMPDMPYMLQNPLANQHGAG